MKKNKQKILVLLDLKENTVETLMYTAKLAELIDGDIQLFCVKKPTEFIDTDSQLSAMRTINRNYIAIDNQINSVLSAIVNTPQANIKTAFAFGNVKNEIENRINSFQPDIIVLGKRKQKTLNFMGDNITDFVSKKYQGTVLIGSNSGGLKSVEDLCLDLVYNENNIINPNMKQKLMC